MISKENSINKNKEELLSLGYRVNANEVEKIVDILFDLANRAFKKDFLNCGFSLEDMLDFEKSKVMEALFSAYFYSDNNYQKTLFSNRDTISSNFFKMNKEEIDKNILKYTISNEITDKEFKRLDKVFASKFFENQSLASLYYKTDDYKLDENPSHLQFQKNQTISVISQVSFDSLNLISHSRLNMKKLLKNDARARADFDIFDRGFYNFTPVYRYEFYENLIFEFEAQNGIYEHNINIIPFDECRESLIQCLNVFDKELFPDDFITLV